MSCIKLIIKSLLFAAVIVPPALAVPIQLTMSGAITASNMTAFGVGQLATVSLVYESGASYQSLMNQQAFYVNAITSVAFTSGGYSGTDNTDPFGVIDKYNNLQPWFSPTPWDGISFAMFHSAGNYTFTNGANTVDLPSVFSNNTTQQFEGIRVNLEANYGTVWNDWALPENLVLSDFNVNQSMLFYFSGGSFMTGMSSMSVVALRTDTPSGGDTHGNTVPDAGPTGLMLLISLGAIAGVRRRWREG
jgi:hypothetical protein